MSDTGTTEPYPPTEDIGATDQTRTTDNQDAEWCRRCPRAAMDEIKRLREIVFLHVDPSARLRPEHEETVLEIIRERDGT